MGKQAKKKQKTEAQAKAQKRHNRGTRGINTKRRPCVWDTRQEIYKDSDGNEKERTVKVTYPPYLQWDWSRIYDAVVDDEGRTRLMRRKPDKQKPLPSPLDTLLEDTWETDLNDYAERHKAKVERTPIGDGIFRYEVWRNEINKRTNKPERKVILAVDSPRSKATLVKKKKRKFSKRKK